MAAQTAASGAESDPQRLGGLTSQESVLSLASRSFFEAVSAMCEGIIVVDTGGRIAWVNDRYERHLPALGYAQVSDIIGQPVEAVVPNSLMRRVLETGEPILLDIIENGARQYVVTRLPLFDDDRRLIGAVGLILFDRLEGLKPLLSRIGHLQVELVEARRQLDAARQRTPFSAIVGISAALREIKRQARRAAQVDDTLLLLGETGTGKELLARAIHGSSRHAGAPMHVLRVQTLGRDAVAAGLAQALGPAQQGTSPGLVFVADVERLDAAAQALLGALLTDSRLHRPRLIAASTLSCEALAQALPQELYHRLSVVPILMPPLRERLEDLPVLCDHLLETVASEHGVLPRELTPEAQRWLAQRAWPGNVRELGNVLRAASLLGNGPALSVDDLVRAVGESAPRRRMRGTETLATPTLARRVEEVERAAIHEALFACAGNKVRAARLLGISRATLYQKLSVYGLGESTA